MLQQMINQFSSAFYFPGLTWPLALIAIAVGLLFGVIWLTPYRPPALNKPVLWIVAVVSALLTWTEIAFIQIPLQNWTGQALVYFWDQATLIKWLLLAGIPQVLLSGLVQEGAKLVPVVFYWLSHNRNLTPRLGLIIGAVSGAGFGVFEAIWVHNSVLAAGWTWQAVTTSGFMAILPWLERFFAVGLHVAVSALAGYGLAKGLGWQFYLISSFLHGLTNYSIVLLQKGLLTPIQIEIYIAVLVCIVSALAYWLRWKPLPEPLKPDSEPASS